MSHVGDRHVVVEVERIVPVDIPVHHRRPESQSAVFPGVAVDPFGPAQELLPVGEQMAVVIEVMNVDFESPATDARQEGVGNRVAEFRDDLERAFDTEGVVEIHQLGAEFDVGGGFDVVGQRGATGSPFGPEPNEGQPAGLAGFHCEDQELLEDALHGPVDWPFGEWDGIAAAKV